MNLSYVKPAVNTSSTEERISGNGYELVHGRSKNPNVKLARCDCASWAFFDKHNYFEVVPGVVYTTFHADRITSGANVRDDKNSMSTAMLNLPDCTPYFKGGMQEVRYEDRNFVIFGEYDQMWGSSAIEYLIDAYPNCELLLSVVVKLDDHGNLVARHINAAEVKACDSEEWIDPIPDDPLEYGDTKND